MLEEEGANEAITNCCGLTGITLKKHRAVKGAADHSELPDRMNNIELLIDRLAKTAGTEIMRARDTLEHSDTREAALTRLCRSPVR